MQTTINWTNSITWVIALALLILLITQLWLLVRNQSLSAGRKWVKGGLNGLLWLVVTGYFLQIHWPIAQPTNHALLVGDEVPATFARRVKDSLHIKDSFTSRALTASYDSVTLLGQDFPTETLTQLSNSAVQWVPYNQPDHLEEIQWKGIVRQGEMQHVTGRIQSAKDQLLKIRFGRQTLDSVALHEGNNTFDLQFPAFARGHSQTDLVLGASTTLDTIRFFTRATEPLKVQFVLNNPDFESKTLADWLGKHGHTVQLSATLSKNVSSSVNINKAGKSAATTPDLIITEPANAGNSTVRKAVADGKAVLFINLTNPETELRSINQALGSKWQARKTSNEPLIPLGNGLNALPYRLVDNLNQFPVSGYPMAVQRTTGRIGVSLLSETFPLSLSGDSLTYNRVWTAVLAQLSQSEKNTVQVNAPVYSGLQQRIYVNNADTRVRAMRVGKDTLQLTYSPINARSAEGTVSFGQVGWQPIQDSLAMYVNVLDPTDPIAGQTVVSRFVSAHSQHQSMQERLERSVTTQIPNWAWLLLIIACCTALWVEPKIQ